MKLKPIIFILTLLIITNSLFAQKLEKGYFIVDEDTTFCYIKNPDLNNLYSPFFIKYTLDDAQLKEFRSIEIDEFYINDEGTYVNKEFIYRKIKNILDDESISIYNTEDERFIMKRAFLKQLVKGRANLYKYVDDTKKSYYFIEKDKQFEELYIKKKLVRVVKAGIEKRGLSTNKTYIGILNLIMQDHDNIRPEIEKTRLNEISLIKLVSKYNEHFGSVIDKDVYHKAMRISTLAGISLNSYNYSDKPILKVPNNITVIGGLKFDFYLAKRKDISINTGILYANYRYQSDSYKDVYGSVFGEVHFNMRYLKFPLLLKYTYLLNKYGIIVMGGVNFNLNFYNKSYLVDGDKKSYFSGSVRKGFEPSLCTGLGFHYKLINDKSFLLEALYENNLNNKYNSELIIPSNLISVKVGMQF